MFRKYVILSLALSFALGTAGCTSNKAEGDGADVEASTDDGLESADATDNNSDLSADNSGAPPADDLAPGESLPDSAVAGDVPPEVAPGDISEAPPADAPEMTADAATPTTDPGATPDPVASTDSVGTPEPTSAEPAPATPQASLQKIKDKPYTKGKTLINAVYLARKGDGPESISQKVFGTNSRTKELCKLNSYNCSRPVKVGDKFYYNSPQRPTDDTSLKIFYEDAGIQPETYVSKAGDNIRKVSKTLLGDSRSWMEVWATNTVESKGKLDEGTQLKYWPKSEVAAPAQAAAAPEQPAEAAPPEMGAPPPPTEVAANEPPPPADLGAPPPPPPSDLPPAPDQGAAGMAAGSVEPPPPPPPPAPMAADPAATAEAGADPNQTMALGVGAVLLLAAAALFISIRKKRQRRQIDYTATQTQIDG